MANENEISQDEAAGVNRRNLLKGAVAAGVGVVAWSSPSITSIGMTPAYAATCTGGTTRYFLGGRNTSCNCDGTGGDNNGSATITGAKYVKYINPKFECDDERISTTLPRVLTHNLTESGVCPKGTSGNPGNNDAYVSIGARSPGGLEFCVITVEIWYKNFCLDGEYITTATSGIVGAGGGTVYMPAVNCASFPSVVASNIFIKVFLECAADEACLYGIGS